MKLHFSADWLRKKLEQCEPEDLDPPCDENGLMACSPEIYAEIMKMTTQVKVEVTQQHMPVMVDLMSRDGSVVRTTGLPVLGSALTEYVHGDQWLRVREATPQELDTSN